MCILLKIANSDRNRPVELFELAPVKTGENRPVQLDPLMRTGYNAEPLYGSSTSFSTSRYNFEFRRFDILIDNVP